MESGTIQTAITQIIVIGFACYGLLYTVISILYYWKQHCKNDAGSYGGDHPLEFLKPNWFYTIKRFFTQKKKFKPKFSRSLPFKIPYKYILYVDYEAYKLKTVQRLIIKCSDLQVQFLGALEMGPRVDGKWGYTRFTLGQVCHINYSKKLDNPSGEALLPYGTSLLEIDKRAREIVNTFAEQRIPSELDSEFADTLTGWLNQTDNFEVMRSHQVKK